MSWKSGKRIMDVFMAAIIDRVPDYSTRVDIYCDIIPIFEEMDCDALYECTGFDEALDNALYVLEFVREYMAQTGKTEAVALSLVEDAFNTLSGDALEDATTMANRLKR